MRMIHKYLIHGFYPYHTQKSMPWISVHENISQDHTTPPRRLTALFVDSTADGIGESRRLRLEVAFLRVVRTHKSTVGSEPSSNASAVRSGRESELSSTANAQQSRLGRGPFGTHDSDVGIDLGDGSVSNDERSAPKLAVLT